MWESCNSFIALTLVTPLSKHQKQQKRSRHTPLQPRHTIPTRRALSGLNDHSSTIPRHSLRGEGIRGVRKREGHKRMSSSIHLFLHSQRTVGYWSMCLDLYITLIIMAISCSFCLSKKGIKQQPLRLLGGDTLGR